MLPLQEQTASARAILPYLLRRSCADYPRFALLTRRLNELYGARIAADVVRVGESQALVLTAVCLDDRFALRGEAVTAQCADLLRSMLFEPVLDTDGFPAADTEQEKRCLVELIQSEINEKRLYARQRCEQILCEGEGYAVNRYGSIAGVEALTPAAIADTWRQVMQSAQFRLFHQGSGDGAAVADAFQAGFGSLAGRDPVSCAVSTDWDVSRGVKEVTERLPLNQSKFVMGFRVSGDPAEADLPAMRLMNALYGGTPHSLLFRNVREKLSLCYYCSSGYDRLKGVMLVDSGVEEANAPRAREEILKQLDAVCRGDFTDDDVESARLSVVNQFQTVDDLQLTLGNWYLGQSLDAALSTPAEAAADIRAVTRNRIVEAARRLRLSAVYLLAGEEGAAHE